MVFGEVKIWRRVFWWVSRSDTYTPSDGGKSSSMRLTDLGANVPEDSQGDAPLTRIADGGRTQAAKRLDANGRRARDQLQSRSATAIVTVASITVHA